MSFEIPQTPQPLRKQANYSPVSDFFAPFFDVVFYSMDTTEGIVEGGFEEGLGTIAKAQRLGASRLQIQSVGGGLQSFTPEGEGSELAGLVNYRANLQVIMKSASALRATLTLTPPYEAALKLVDNRLIRFGTLMEIQWGYLSTDGEGSPAISDKGLFRITPPSIKFGRETTVTISGWDVLSSSLSTADVRCCWPRSKYACDLDILRALLKPPRAPAGLKLIDTEVTSKSALRRRKPDDVIQAATDWTFFRRICRQNDVSFRQQYDEVQLFDESRLDSIDAKYRLTWFMQPQGKFDVPMISFETNAIASLFANDSKGIRGQRTFCRDSKTGEIRVINKETTKTGKTHTGAGVTDASKAGHETDTKSTSEAAIASFQDLEKNVCASGKIFTDPCNKPNQAEEADREILEGRRYFNTRAVAICPGVPGLVPQQLTEVMNVGEKFGGCYRIITATHNIGAGYTVKLDLIRASSSGVKDGTPATEDRANCIPVDLNAAPGEEVLPTPGGDPPVGINSQVSGGGCLDESPQRQEAQNILSDRPVNQPPPI